MMQNIRSGAFDGKYLTSYRMAIVMFAFFSVYLSKYPLEKVDLKNLGQGDRAEQSRTFTMVPFDGIYQPL